MESTSESDPETYAIIGAAMEVHSHLGPGFFESVYQEALCRELTARGIDFRSEIALPIYFKGTRLASLFRTDLICFGEVIVELKALRVVGDNEMAQVINYLKASKLSKGLLINFGARSLQYRRLVL
jgi:GxxExxY protein